jgi:hypothetical protein
MPWHLAHALLGDVSLAPSNEFIKCYPFRHILKCVVPLTLDKIKVNIDFHIFDIFDLDILLGYPIAKHLDPSLGSLNEKITEATFAISFLENHSAKPAPEKNPLDGVKHVDGKFLTVKMSEMRRGSTNKVP